MILFKYPELQRELANIDRRLRIIVECMDEFAWNRWKDDLVVTSIYRDQDGSVHKYWRGIDIALLEHGVSEELRRFINASFVYDPDRPEIDVIPKLRHGTAPHFHVQVWIK